MDQRLNAKRRCLNIKKEVKEKIPTKFPAEIDERIYFNDIDLKQVATMQRFYQYINLGLYAKAFELLDSSEAFYYGAWLLNMLEDRLYIIGDYISKIEKPKIFSYGTSEPPIENLNNEEYYNWIDVDTNNVSSADPINKLWHWDGSVRLDGTEIFL